MRPTRCQLRYCRSPHFSSRFVVRATAALGCAPAGLDLRNYSLQPRPGSPALGCTVCFALQCPRFGAQCGGKCVSNWWRARRGTPRQCPARSSNLRSTNVAGSLRLHFMLLRFHTRWGSTWRFAAGHVLVVGGYVDCAGTRKSAFACNGAAHEEGPGARAKTTYATGCCSTSAVWA